MGGGAPAAALVVAAAAAAVLATNRYARGARHSLARPPRLCACPPACPRLWQMAARAGRKRLRARRGGLAAPPLLPLAAVVRGQGRRSVARRRARHLKVCSGGSCPLAPVPPPRPRPRPSARQAKVGGLARPLRAAAPPPLLRPRPPLKQRGRGLWFDVSAAAGLRPLRRARKSPPREGRAYKKLVTALVE